MCLWSVADGALCPVSQGPAECHSENPRRIPAGKNARREEAGWEGLVITVNVGQEQLQNFIQIVRVGGFSYVF